MAKEGVELVYVKMTHAHADARYGKLAPGRVLQLPRDVADRWASVGLVADATEAAYTKQREQKQGKVDSREEAFARLNNRGAELWDVSTHRDALTAPREGLERARAAGIPLVNTDMLRDEDGVPLDPDASVDEIMEARANLHPDAQSPLTAHSQASTSGGGSHYDMPMPLNPQARAMEESIRSQERNASVRQEMVTDYNQQHRSKSERRMAGRDAPKPAEGSQVGTAPEKKD